VTAPPADNTAAAALLLAVMAWVWRPVVLGVAALVLARSAQRSIDAARGALGGQGMVTAARVVAWANIAVFGLAVFAGLAFLTVAAFRAR